MILRKQSYTMERKEFLKRGLTSLGIMAIAPLMSSCKTDNVTTDAGSSSSTGSTNGSSANDCANTAFGEEGPFPTKKPANFAIKDIRAGRQGIEMTTNISIKNKNTGCGALAGAIVDIWHCDAAGSYSEYGSDASLDFLRGRQVTDVNGLASFTTIFPGWYGGRAVHIHVHIYDSKGKSLLITQMAFPAVICDTVYTTATTLYKKGKADTSNERDNVFKNTLSTLLSTVSGSVKDGYVLAHNIVVSA
jgi:protocatechuate 3,4-dioxygenase beta subunit